MTTSPSRRRVALSNFIQRVPPLRWAKALYIEWRWRRVGRPVPAPHAVKRRVVRSYARRYGLHTLVETGTYLGDMVAGTAGSFRSVYSIELDSQLAEAATRRFANVPKIMILQGDSGEQIAKVLDKIDEPALFWLDAHYSEGETARGLDETPILRELAHVLDQPVGHVLLIDDARDFTGKGGYPSIPELEAFVRARLPGWKLSVSDDIIRIHG